MSIQIHTHPDSLRELRKSATTLALVPTMGNLHDGHLALVEQAAQAADNVIVSIFVNRLQFGVGEDFERYPRTLEEDCEKLTALGVKHVFAPAEDVLYPHTQRFHISPDPSLDAILEGGARPHHFRGVATVVLKLFNLIQPDSAVFGKKDYQQLLVIRQMVREFNLPLEILAGEIVRDADGLALSSRNRYLSGLERQQAPRLYQTLCATRNALRDGKTDLVALEQAACQSLQEYGWQPDYLSVRERDTLACPTQYQKDEMVILAAARLGSTRLLDNIEC